ncbi:MAG: DUF3160 domain-containing protein [Verrucomicrobiota bacterium]
MKRIIVMLSLAGPAVSSLFGVPLVECHVSPFAPIPVAITGAEKPSKPMESAPPRLENASNMDRLLKEKLGISLTSAERDFLAKNQFVLLDLNPTKLATLYEKKDPDSAVDYRSTDDEMLNAFDSLSGGDRYDTSWHPKLVTPDLFLHAYHRFFSHSLEFIEQRQLRPRLEKFLESAMKNAAELRPQADAATAARIEWVEAQLATAWIVLGTETAVVKSENEESGDETQNFYPKADARSVRQRLASLGKRFSKPVTSAITAEVELILAAKGPAPSPLYSCYVSRPTDYTQFIPRSHYTKTEGLRGWFRSMMFLGLTGQTLPGENNLGLTDSLLLTQIIARQPAKGPRPLDAWRDLMEITTFFAGQSDDLDYPVMRDWVNQTLGATPIKIGTATDPAVLEKLKAAVKNLPQPQIVSGSHPAELNSPDQDPPSFRIFGQRFSADAWILSALTRESPGKAPSMPAATFVTAAFGDDFSLRQAQSVLNPAHVGLFNTRIEDLRKKLTGKSDAEWFVSMAGAQLKAATSLCGGREPNFPFYMQSLSTAAKNVESMLGSWTELKHDTVLYAKQSYAEAGEGGEPDKPLPPITRGFVQPDVKFWRAMERLAGFTATGFAKHKLLPDAGEEFFMLNEFVKHTRFCRVLAEKEIAGTKITREEYDKLDTMTLGYMDRSLDSNEVGSPDRGKTALVTDVFTDAGGGSALHEALGQPCLMLALVGDKPSTRVVTGVAYRHFEFTRSMDSRMTDEEWKKAVYQPNAELPARAGWAVPVFTPVPVKEK